MLRQYVDQGSDELNLDQLTPLLKLKYGAMGDALAMLGKSAQVNSVFVKFQRYLYAARQF